MLRHPLRHWYYGHFHQSWHQEIEDVQYNLLDIMELRKMEEKKNMIINKILKDERQTDYQWY